MHSSLCLLIFLDPYFIILLMLATKANIGHKKQRRIFYKNKPRRFDLKESILSWSYFLY